ncbi:MAG: triose-phosphate isomerase [Candidatus Micrarchaeia archaeon]
MKKNVVVLNFKVYAESSGEYGLRLARAADSVARQMGKSVVVVPPVPEVAIVSKEVSVPVFAQAADANRAGAFTGSITLESLKEAGAKGTLVNHSEKRVKPEDVEAVVNRAGELGLETIVCAATVEEGARLAAFGPTAVAVEPPELIGSGISVSTARPEIVSDSVREIKAVGENVLVLVGAGVSTPGDVAKAVELGADGVLLASAFVKASDPEGLLKAMVKEF